jgi:ATP-dependent helicase HrpA
MNSPTTTLLDELTAAIAYCPLRLQPALKRRLANLAAQPAALAELRQKIQQGIAESEQRLAALPALDYPDLPVSQEREKIKNLLLNHQIVVIAGETGSGKTTQLPKICLEVGRGILGLIGHTQPRRIAARNVALRLAEELKSPLGQAVGYQVRFEEKLSKNNYIKVMTDGILLAEMQQYPELLTYDTLIIDEAHERSLNIDFLLGVLKGLCQRRPELKVIITSATIDHQRFADFFQAPVLEIAGRSYPVEILYHDYQEEEQELGEAIVEVVEVLQKKHGSGDTLIFLPTEKAIFESKALLEKTFHQHYEILPLFARLNVAEQQKVFGNSQKTKLILTTNVAETSLTVPGIRYVIDSGLARLRRYSPRSKLERLPIEMISKAAARQRAGRCGRVGPGICVRLYSLETFEAQDDFTPAEILRSNLAAVILQLDLLKLGRIEDFPFLEAPDNRQIQDGYTLLSMLGAWHDHGEISALGQKLARLPLDPRLGRILLAAAEKNVVSELLVIVGFLGLQDPRERPNDRAAAADDKHRRFHDGQSDLHAILNLWLYLSWQQQNLSKNKFRELCRREFIAYSRFLEWQSVVQELENTCKEDQDHFKNFSGLKLPNLEKIGDLPWAKWPQAAIHQAFLSGFLDQIAMKDKQKDKKDKEQGDFIAARNRRVFLFPGSSLSKNPPPWIVAAEIMETSKVFARHVGTIDPTWLEKIGEHLIKSEYYQPHWDKVAGEVYVFERVFLYGLTIVEKRKKRYAPIDPTAARKIFIQEGLLPEDGYGEVPPDFLQEHQRSLKILSEQEAKRRQGGLVPNAVDLEDFYQKCLPKEVVGRRSLEKVLEKSANLCAFPEAWQALALSQEAYPDSLEVAGARLALRYHFEPGHPEDGISIAIPLPVLTALPPAAFSATIPAWLSEKVQQALKSLPKNLRKNLLPIHDTATNLLPELAPLLSQGQDFFLVLAKLLQQKHQLSIKNSDWRADLIEDYLFFRFEIIDEQGKVFDSSRDLLTLQKRFAEQSRLAFEKKLAQSWQRLNVKTFDFELPERIEIEGIPAFPAVIPASEDSVDLKLLESPQAALQQSRQGIRILLRQALKKELKELEKSLSIKQLQLAGLSLGDHKNLQQSILRALLDDLFRQELPRTPHAFEKIVHEGRKNLLPKGQAFLKLTLQILESTLALRKKITQNQSLATVITGKDILEQLDSLVYPGFIEEIPEQYLQDYPRYLAAAEKRLEKAGYKPDQDRLRHGQFAPLWQKFKPLWESHRQESTVMAFRFLLEEWRIQVFVQELAAKNRVSQHKLQENWKNLTGEENF